MAFPDREKGISVLDIDKPVLIINGLQGNIYTDAFEWSV